MLLEKLVKETLCHPGIEITVVTIPFSTDEDATYHPNRGAEYEGYFVNTVAIY